jgi:D-glycero-D-manno-heptose 1,7-bisphosphate phosphatase
MRKPSPGMFLKAAETWNIDLTESVSVGDSERDVEASQMAGVRHIYYLSELTSHKNEDIHYINSLLDILPFPLT